MEEKIAFQQLVFGWVAVLNAAAHSCSAGKTAQPFLMDSLEGGKEENLTLQREAARRGMLKDYSGHSGRHRR